MQGGSVKTGLDVAMSRQSKIQDGQGTSRRYVASKSMVRCFAAFPPVPQAVPLCLVGHTPEIDRQGCAAS